MNLIFNINNSLQSFNIHIEYVQIKRFIKITCRPGNTENNILPILQSCIMIYYKKNKLYMYDIKSTIDKFVQWPMQSRSL